jgi:hypothetical protein
VDKPERPKEYTRLSDVLNKYAREDANVSENIRREEAGGDLTTADLAGAGERDERAADVAGNVDSRSGSPMTQGINLGSGGAPGERVGGPTHEPNGAERAAAPGTGTGIAGGMPRSSGAGAATATAPEQDRAQLFPSEEAKDLRARWDSVQVGFVDEPRQAVEEADRLVASTMKRLAEIFADERQKLEHQWDRGDNVSTEDFRLALRRYRSFFSRLLSF